MIRFEKKPKIAIVGLGNELMTDDGIGIHAIRLLQDDDMLEDEQVVEVGTAALHFQYLFEQSDIVIAIDAICAGGIAGQLYCFDGQEAATTQTHSLHDLGATGVLQLIPEECRPKLIILGAEPKLVDYGTELSETLQAILPQLVQTVKEVLDKIKNTDECLKLNDLFSIRI